MRRDLEEHLAEELSFWTLMRLALHVDSERQWQAKRSCIMEHYHILVVLLTAICVLRPRKIWGFLPVPTGVAVPSYELDHSITQYERYCKHSLLQSPA